MIRDDAYSQRARFARELAHDWRSTSAGTATHATGDEDEVTVGEHAEDFVAILFDRLAANFRPGARTEPARELLADLDLDVRLRVQERLRVGVDRDELDAAEALLDHAVDCIPAAAADANDAHPGALRGGFLKLENAHGKPEVRSRRPNVS